MRIVVVDDHPVMRDIVRLALEGHPHLEVVGEAGNGLDALALCAEVVPDVVVLDLVMPGLDGFEVARRLRSEGAATKVLVLSARDDPAALLDAVRAGVDGYLDKNTAREHLAGAIEAVSSGLRVFTPEQQKASFDQLGRIVQRARDASRIAEALSEREADVLVLLGDGLTTRQIATRLGLSPRTVDSHLTKLYRKLGVGTRMQAVSRAARLGLLEGRDPGSGSRGGSHRRP